jgi:putative hydrolase of HD superfamily
MPEPSAAPNLEDKALAQPTPEEKAVVPLCFELAQLKLTRRSGWNHIGADPESVAEHSHRAAALAYFLAVHENHPKPELVVTMVVFHDMHEARTGDDDRVQKRYIQVDGRRAMEEQTAPLGLAGSAIAMMWEEVESRSTPAGKIAKDADILEMAFTARELVVGGNPAAQRWIDDVRPLLKTDSAKRLLDILDTADPSEWWRSIFDGNNLPHIKSV